MRLVDRLMGRAQPPIADYGTSVLMTSFGQPDKEKILPGFLNAAGAYGSSGVVFGVILARLMLFSEAEFKFQRLRDRSLFGDQSLGLLEKPWPDGTTGELLARMEQDASLAGNAFIRKVNPERLERLRPDWVTIVSEVEVDEWSDTEVRTVRGFLYDPPPGEDRKAAFYHVEEVAHFAPIPDPMAHHRGMSWLTPVLREVDADLQMTDYKRAYLENAATPNLLVKYQKKVSQEAMDRLAAQMHAKHGGAQNAFKTLILDEGADTTVLGHNFEQMQYAAVQAAGENRIAVAAGVPAIVAGLKEGLSSATYSNYGLAMRRFADLTARPWWRAACASLAHLVDVPEDARLWFDTSQIAALQEGGKEAADTMQVLATAAELFIRAGYKPETIAAALAASDVTLLDHTGLVSIQLQVPGSSPEKPSPAPEEGA